MTPRCDRFSRKNDQYGDVGTLGASPSPRFIRPWNMMAKWHILLQEYIVMSPIPPLNRCRPVVCNRLIEGFFDISEIPRPWLTLMSRLRI
jgi:hypothetical protein